VNKDEYIGFLSMILIR